jgi:hypothetical protein
VEVGIWGDFKILEGDYCSPPLVVVPPPALIEWLSFVTYWIFLADMANPIRKNKMATKSLGIFVIVFLGVCVFLFRKSVLM